MSGIPLFRTSTDTACRRIGFQDVAKAGLKFGDEMTDEEEKAEREMYTEKYQPLIEWLRKEVREKGAARDVVISNRLVESSCAIVADESGYTANLEKLISMCSAPQPLPRDADKEPFGRLVTRTGESQAHVGVREEAKGPRNQPALAPH